MSEIWSNDHHYKSQPILGHIWHNIDVMQKLPVKSMLPDCERASSKLGKREKSRTDRSCSERWLMESPASCLTTCWYYLYILQEGTTGTKDD